MNTALVLLNVLALTTVIGLSQFGGAADQVAQLKQTPALSARQAVMGDAPAHIQRLSSDRVSF
ncbi:MAG TPA: hypothetical protein VJS90_21560 [Pseudomonas sp.]|uniref:hypothetical protein n=1 Tax=Pseudomonas sp. TaxID=306 RepID=UPI002B47EF22|nr:hypothetical protein [Pseudomonas sp.]HKS15622.1 hypothetical protein [Pseudomonas sp.]